MATTEGFERTILREVFQITACQNVQGILEYIRIPDLMKCQSKSPSQRQVCLSYPRVQPRFSEKKLNKYPILRQINSLGLQTSSRIPPKMAKMEAFSGIQEKKEFTRRSSGWQQQEFCEEWST